MTALPIPLEHLRASKAAEAVRQHWPSATIIVDEDQNFVIISHVPSSQLREVKNFITALDK